jgi:glutathione peroxidase-family protein
MPAFHDLVLDDLEGNAVSFDRYRGKLVLVVNVASY